jgi:hypothetical protein
MVVAVYHGAMNQGRLAFSPRNTAARFSRSKNASPNESRIWSPKNGEKLKKTPSAKAAAVRRELSCRCSSASIHWRQAPLRDS